MAVLKKDNGPGTYWMCNACGEKKGGKVPIGHVFTAMEGTCSWCGDKKVTLIPWVDFNWPKDKRKNIEANYGRD